MFKSGPFALCFPLFLAVCRCAVNSEETALKLKDIKPETSGIEENSDWNEGKNIKHTGENNGVRELNDGMQRGERLKCHKGHCIEKSRSFLRPLIGRLDILRKLQIVSTQDPDDQDTFKNKPPLASNLNSV